MVDPFTAALLVSALFALSRDKPIPILEKLFGGGGNARKMRRVLRDQPVLSQAEIATVTYMRGGVRYFNRDLCAPLFDALSLAAIEPIDVPGRPPGSFLLVQYRGTGDRADVAVLEATKEGLHACINVAAVLDESADKILVFTPDPKIAHDKSQIAVLGPIPSLSPYREAPRPAMRVTSGPRVMSAPPIDAEYSAAQNAGIPVDHLKALLSSSETKAESLDEIALITSREFPAITQALRSRASQLRARQKIEELTGGTRIVVREKTGEPAVSDLVREQLGAIADRPKDYHNPLSNGVPNVGGFPPPSEGEKATQ